MAIIVDKEGPVDTDPTQCNTVTRISGSIELQQTTSTTSTPNGKQKENVSAAQYVQQNRYCRLLKNQMFWSRILTLLFSVILLALSTAYCIASQSTVKLELLKECDPKTSEKIWDHSYESAEFIDGQPVLSAESQFGLNDDSCWTTKSLSVNTDQLWYSNNYEHHWKRPLDVDYRFVLFVVLTMYTLIVTLYTAWSIVSDLIAVQTNELHTKCSKYKPPGKQLIYVDETNQSREEEVSMVRFMVNHPPSPTPKTTESPNYSELEQYLSFVARCWIDIDSPLLSQSDRLKKSGTEYDMMSSEEYDKILKSGIIPLQ